MNLGASSQFHPAIFFGTTVRLTALTKVSDEQRHCHSGHFYRTRSAANCSRSSRSKLGWQTRPNANPLGVFARNRLNP